ncbi:hypothetical protein FS837_012180 [Tulasnella sp. UAMH 9824]|nr:hypothetical protein FS837_012180 [Tulasnella sp. UAMH 9824]
MQILGGYHFLTENYQEGDYVCIFGFGRGAYIARCLAGMLSKVGLVRNINEERTYSTPVPIAFVGVWETVASAGWTFKHFPFASSNGIIRRFRHALALDEHRVEFLPNPWHSGSVQDFYALKHDPPWETEVFEDDFAYHLGKPTDVKEVWFAGRRADVGGGSSRRADIHSLANPSFQWMVSEVLRHSPYVLFRSNAFEDKNGFSALIITKTDLIPKPARPHIPSTLRLDATTEPPPSPTPKPLPLAKATGASAALNGREVEEEQTVVVVEQTDPEADANAPMNDQLVKGLMWLVLEYIPMSQYYQDSDGYCHKRLRWNAGRPRGIYNITPNFHVSVKLRKDYEGKWLTRFIPKTGQQVKVNYVE